MSETLNTTEAKTPEIPIEMNAIQAPTTDPDPPCCTAPGDPNGGPDT